MFLNVTSSSVSVCLSLIYRNTHLLSKVVKYDFWRPYIHMLFLFYSLIWKCVLLIMLMDDSVLYVSSVVYNARIVHHKIDTFSVPGLIHVRKIRAQSDRFHVWSPFRKCDKCNWRSWVVYVLCCSGHSMRWY